MHSRPDFRVFETGTGDCARRDEIVSRFLEKKKTGTWEEFLKGGGVRASEKEARKSLR